MSWNYALNCMQYKSIVCLAGILNRIGSEPAYKVNKEDVKVKGCPPKEKIRKYQNGPGGLQGSRKLVSPGPDKPHLVGQNEI